MQPTPFSRRKFVQLAGLSSAGALLAAAHGPAGAQAAGVRYVSNQQSAAEAQTIPMITIEPIGSYAVERLNKILTTELADFSDYPVEYPPARYPVDLYRVLYPSIIPEQDNRPTLASGLIALPNLGRETPGKLPLVSYQHGTVYAKNEVPSDLEHSMETRLMVAQFAGQGYALIGADYFGRGQSPETDSYLVKASTQQACLDMLFAAQAAFPALGIEVGPLFLSGWSQGGWATMIFLEKLESLGIAVKAAAVASAPVDLFAIINRWFHAPAAIDAIYLPTLLAMQSNSYERYYGLPGLANSIIQPQYQEASLQLYLGELTLEEMEKKLPSKMTDLLTPEFITSSSAGTSRYWRLVQDNHGYRWRSEVPLRTYWGGSDEVIPPYIAQLPVGYQQLMGGAEVTAVASGAGANHRGNFVYAVADQKKWFDQLLA